MKRIFFTILFLGLYIFLVAQPTKRNQKLFEIAKIAFQDGNKTMAIETALQILKTDSININTHLLLADVYQSLDSIESEIKHLELASGDTSELNSLIGLRLGEAYFYLGNYKNSLYVFEKIDRGKISGDRKEKIEDRITRCRFAIDAMNTPVSEVARDLGTGINTDLEEYWPNLSIDGKTLIFTRLINPEKTGRFKQEDFYTTQFLNDQWETATPISEINTEENEGAQTLSADGKLMFFSACNRSDGFGSCDIYYSRKIGDNWTKPQNAGKPVCSGAWESQPSLSSNTGYLYFTSNRSGGVGGMDIWRCRFMGFNPEGRPDWGIPENLGKSINTSGNELSPFIHFNGKDLYFSSDKWIGLGKKDIFHSRLKPDLTWAKPENIGYPINTCNDEQGLVINAKGTTGYYASNRKGNMDIYSFELFPQIQPQAVTYIKGKVKDAVTKQTLMAEVELRDIKQGQVDTVLTDVKGEFLVTLPLGANYAFNVLKKGYLFFSESFELNDVREVTNPFELEILLRPISEGSNIVLKNVYYNTNSFELLPESKPELEKVEELLINNPAISIEIEGHTDNVGSEDFNQVLSENRAKAVFDYLIHSGIDKQRLSYKGYGFSRPVSQNDTEEGKRQNRRTEIKITGIKYYGF